MMNEGDSLPTVHKTVTQAHIERYAEASGDFNPIHVDHEVAAASRFGGTIAHGMMIAASISEMMSLAFREAWAANGRLKLKFRAPVRPGDRVTASGRVKKIREGPHGREVVCAVQVHRQTGEAAITGEATVTAPGPPETSGHSEKAGRHEDTNEHGAY